jgi:hypothetical protein
MPCREPAYLVILFEYMHTFRSIPLKGQPHPVNMGPGFIGDSAGHWEGVKISPPLPELIEYLCSENNRDIQHLISTKPGVGSSRTRGSFKPSGRLPQNGRRR